ncbi:MAG: AmmeMemoRadiSam system protein B [Spirochaetales bacterium]|nr:AmmeMemoRadiSam system protein B [Spirochaetales bacterium]
MAEKIRQMIACGKLYPSDMETLDKMTDIQPDNKGEVNAIIVPEGSYTPALDCYKAAYSTVAGKHYDTAVIISPMHHFSFPAIALTKYDKWASPYGEIAVDTEANNILHKFRSEYIYCLTDQYETKFSGEFSTEVQLPFIYKALGKNTKIVPIIIGENNTKFTIMLANALNALLEDGIKNDKKYLIIVTTNLSEKSKFDDAIIKDTNFAKILCDMKPDRFSEQLALGTIVAHGGGGVTVLLRLAEKTEWKNINVLKIYNTGDITGEKLEVDGYIAACL